LLVSQYVFHHIPQWDKTIYEISRVLKNNGYLFWSDLAIPKIFVLLLKNMVKNYGLYTINNIRTHFKYAGLEEKYYEKVVRVPMITHDLILRKNV